MLMVISLICIIALQVGVVLLNRWLSWRLCTICTAVGSTWIGLLIARWSGYTIDPSVIALFIGGTVVGSAYQAEKKVALATSRIIIKSLGIPLGFLGGYSLLVEQWGTLLVSGGSILTLFLYILIHESRPSKPSHDKNGKNLLSRLSDCCW